MTPKEIKKIAEEYLLDITGKVDSNYSHEFQNFLSWLTKHFYLVEKGKVERIYKRKTIPSQEDIDRKFLEEIIIESIFGPDIRKEEE